MHTFISYIILIFFTFSFLQYNSGIPSKLSLILICAIMIFDVSILYTFYLNLSLTLSKFLFSSKVSWENSYRLNITHLKKVNLNSVQLISIQFNLQDSTRNYHRNNILKRNKPIQKDATILKLYLLTS